MNSTKKCNGIKSMNSRKNKLNSKKKKKNWFFKPMPNPTLIAIIA